MGIFGILLLKVFCVWTILGSIVLWFVEVRNHYRQFKNPNIWWLIPITVSGLLLSLYFIDGWKP